MGICPSSVSQLSQNLLGGFLSNFSCCCPGPYARCFFFFFFLIFEKKKPRLPNFVFVNTVPYGSKNFQTQLFSIFLNYEFTIFHEFLSFSLTWDPMGGKVLKNYYYFKRLWNFPNFSYIFYPKALCKSLFTVFKLLLNFLLSGPHKSTVFGIFEILSFRFLIIFLEILRSPL